MFLTLHGLYSLRANDLNIEPHGKVAKLEKKFSLILGCFEVLTIWIAASTECKGRAKVQVRA